jgi:hypothetical protein
VSHIIDAWLQLSRKVMARDVTSQGHPMAEIDTGISYCKRVLEDRDHNHQEISPRWLCMINMRLTDDEQG